MFFFFFALRLFKTPALGGRNYKIRPQARSLMGDLSSLLST